MHKVIGSGFISIQRGISNYFVLFPDIYDVTTIAPYSKYVISN